jgi:hypothetical protein
MRHGLVVLVASVSLLVASLGWGYAATTADSTPKIEVRLTPEKTVIRPGETLRLKVEIWNVGADDILIAQKVDATYGNSDLRLFLEVASKRETSRGAIADSIPEPDPDFEKVFVTNWLTLNKAHFYGTYVDMDPIEFPELRKTGYYRVGAEYYSRGISSTPGWNGGYLKQADIDKLPFKAWQGTIDSNVVTIQVTPRTNKKGK